MGKTGQSCGTVGGIGAARPGLNVGFDLQPCRQIRHFQRDGSALALQDPGASVIAPEDGSYVIAVREKSKKQGRVLEALELAKQVGMPAWVEVNVDKAEGTFKKSPDRDEFAADINESLIVELYSR